MALALAVAVAVAAVAAAAAVAVAVAVAVAAMALWFCGKVAPPCMVCTVPVDLGTERPGRNLGWKVA